MEDWSQLLGDFFKTDKTWGKKRQVTFDLNL